MNSELGTLNAGEPHPSSSSAFRYIKETILMRPIVHEAIASCALSCNRTAEICSETLRRIMNDEPVSDRYLLGLAWFLWEMENRN